MRRLFTAPHVTRFLRAGPNEPVQFRWPRLEISRKQFPERLALDVATGKITYFQAARPALVKALWDYVPSQAPLFPAHVWRSLVKGLELHSVFYRDDSSSAELTVRGLPTTCESTSAEESRFRILKIQAGDQVYTPPPPSADTRCHAVSVGMRF
ncbi:MAG: hypothetical protein ACOZIN_03975 [Myxococcota bacterium]